MKRTSILLAALLCTACVHGASPTEPVCPTGAVYTTVTTYRPATRVGEPNYTVDSIKVECLDWTTARR